VDYLATGEIVGGIRAYHRAMSREYDKFADRDPDQIFSSLTANQRDRIARAVCVEASGLGKNGNSSSLFARTVVQDTIVTSDSTAILHSGLTRLPDGKYVGMWNGITITVDGVRNAGIDSQIRPVFRTRINPHGAGNVPLVLEVKGGTVVRIIDLVLGEELVIGDDAAEILLGRKRHESPVSTPALADQEVARAGDALELAFRAGYADGYQGSLDRHHSVGEAWRAHSRLLQEQPKKTTE
jgi:hypothetical protein